MHWYTWALVLWATLSGVLALAALCGVLAPVVARRTSEAIGTRAEVLPVAPVPAATALLPPGAPSGASADRVHVDATRTGTLVSELARQAG
jgi:hypothetical protein